MEQNGLTESPLPIIDFSELDFAYGKPRCTAELKQRVEDFQVDEVIGFNFADKGEHLCLQIQKTDQSTLDVARKLASQYTVSVSDVGYAGMKDRRGICTQWFSVPIAEKGRFHPAQIESENLVVKDVKTNDRKIRIGSHRGNSFHIRLRNLKGSYSELQDRVSLIAAEGVPNYFGNQRFGFEMGNVRDALDFFATLNLTGRKNRIPRPRRSILLSASRSYLFNIILARRVAERNWNRLLDGEVLNLDGTQRFFKPSGDDDIQEQGDSQLHTLESRLRQHDIHPTGLLFGKVDRKTRYLATGTVAKLESGALQKHEQLCQGLLAMGVLASRRPLRQVPGNLSMNLTNTGDVTLQFELWSGGYATSVLRELCNTVTGYVQ